MKIRSLQDLEDIKNKTVPALYHPEGIKVNFGMASCGISAGAKKALQRAQEEWPPGSNGLRLAQTGCLGFCQEEPLVEILEPGSPRIVYKHITEEKIIELINARLKGDLKGKWALGQFKDPRSILEEDTPNPVSESVLVKNIPILEDIPFYGKQLKVALRNCGYLDPDNIEEYIGRGGFFALHRCLSEIEPSEIIEIIKASGLRGRGGGGFPTGIKWETCRKAHGEQKYVICNADEGDPGAYMDRSILEGDPFSVIEGMIIGAYAIGSSEGYIYVRNEYPLAVKRLIGAIKTAEAYGLLGPDIMGSGFSFSIKISTGAGAFVCGESTALMSSLEGKVGRPRAKYVHTVEKGFRDSPSNLNNVETWANVPVIIAKGADWYAGLGTEHSKGTKVFSLVGKVRNSGLVEVPMGTALREIIFEIGNGTMDGRRFKAVQTGGPSGGCIPEELIDTPVDYEQLTKLGSIMGSGGMIVMDQDTCMVNLARYFMEFLVEESCGQCVPCREGLKRLLQILTDICEGNGREEDLELLEELSATLRDFSLCGLGKTAPNPVMSTLRYFREEYEAHIRDRQCPALACTGLVPAPCQMACPAGIDIPSYVALIGHGRYEEAVELIREDNPFPWVCGLICIHPCENACRRGEVDKPISIKNLKGFAAEHAIRTGGYEKKKLAPVRNEKVAIIGSGPAGLTAAYYLAREGYPVTIFEAAPVPGGLLRLGIPEYRLPKHIVETEVESIKALGVEIKTNTPIGKDVTLDDLRKQGFAAFFLGIGAHKGFRLNIEGESDFDGVIDCIHFLKKVNLSEEVNLGQRVVVIGGGHSSMDAARTCIRLGVPEVSIVYRRSKDEMPAGEEEIQVAQEEGVKIHFLTIPKRIKGRDGKVTHLECMKAELGKQDESGRRRAVPLKGTEFDLEADTIILSIGQSVDLGPIIEAHEIGVTPRSTFQVDVNTMQTRLPDIFAGGDCVSGPASVIEAIAAGKKAARAIHRYLRGESLEEKIYHPIKRMKIEEIEVPEEEKEALKRPDMPMLAVTKRKITFEKAELGFTEEMAKNEAKRCLRCDLHG
ncbi:MAG: FAD-dependent oxidoreductase [Deltaproteobacteria bacterium]|nr:FAD-dependent oxidoreductase [Deltaproteobacteria bacterium]MBW2018652.1 FAD-dependent oxidoreductase [Deltaproteobacteria bacterium]MBW2073381.1 FAD-dependent oxidoreductase [Deltaproteobacteria bacterium]RLB83936.1 MAG: hydrogenase [Deltaproteobacteria bacterium]